METAAQDIARRFLSSGKAASGTERDLTAACIQLILAASRRSFRRALTLSERFVRVAGGHSAHMRMMAYRALGQMNHLSGQRVEALEAYRKARRLASGDPVARASMDRMLIDIYMYLARYPDARRSARRALSVFERAGMEADWHKTRVNYANVLHRLDRHADAGQLYREAAEFFAGSGDDLSAARCRFNLGNTLVQLFEIEEAERCYGYARKIWEREHYELDACDVRYGQAWLKMLKGELHVAMTELCDCRRAYRDGGNRRGDALCTLDLAEVYLGLGLHSDALECARKAERLFSRMKLRYERAKSALFRAQAAVALGKKRESLAAGKRAKAGFGAEKNHGFSGVTQLLFADLTETRGAIYLRRIGQAQTLFRQSQLPLWQAVCDLRLALEPSRSRQALGRLARNNAAGVVPHLYASWQTALGDWHQSRGEGKRARTCWGRAADRLDTVRSQLPPVELRTAYGRTAQSPHARLVAAEASRSPRRAAVWSERLKTAGIWAPIAPSTLPSQQRRRVTTSLDSLASQVAFLMRQVPGDHGERGMTAPSAQRALRKLQRQIRLELSRVEAATQTSSRASASLDELIETTSELLPIVQFHVAESDILAFVHQNRKTTVCRIEHGRRRVESAMERWRFFMERELFSGFPGRRIEASAERALWLELGRWLWEPLRVDPAAEAVLIVAEGELANMPWQALEVDGRPLCLRYHIIQAPSIRHFAAANAVRVSSPEVRIFRGDGGNLPRLDSELRALQKHVGGRLIMHNPSRRADWPTEGENHVWHYSGHAILWNENPFYSYLMLSDGPMFAADFRMRQCRLNLATLAACQTGEQVALPGEESTGLVRSLLEMGARNVIAGQWPVSDESAAAWMTHFYGRYFNDIDLFTAAREAAMKVREEYPSAFHWAAFSVFGAGRMGGSDEAS